MPQAYNQLELLPEVSLLLPPVRSLFMVAIVWDGGESVAWRQEAELSAYCLRVTQRSRFASFSRLLVFRPDMLEMSSRWQAVATMLYTT